MSITMNEQTKLKLQEEDFGNSPLDEEEQWYEDNADDFVPSENQIELRQSLMEAAQNTIKSIKYPAFK